MRDGPPAQGLNEPARGRLARISHHFLSEERTTRLLALSTDADRPRELPPEQLARALARRGATAAVLNSEHGLSFYAALSATGSPARPELRLTAERLKEYWEACRSPSVLISPADNLPTGMRAALLLTLPADDTGMRRAYLRLKTITARPSVTGVTVTGATDRYQAESAYERFAAAASRFLGIEVTSYAYLPGGWSPDGSDRELDNIATLLLEDWRTEAQENGTGRDTTQPTATVASEEIA